MTGLFASNSSVGPASVSWGDWLLLCPFVLVGGALLPVLATKFALSKHLKI